MERPHLFFACTVNSESDTSTTQHSHIELNTSKSHDTCHDMSELIINTCNTKIIDGKPFFYQGVVNF